jgi:hypothetical protein
MDIIKLAKFTITYLNNFISLPRIINSANEAELIQIFTPQANAKKVTIIENAEKAPIIKNVKKNAENATTIKGEHFTPEEVTILGNMLKNIHFSLPQNSPQNSPQNNSTPFTEEFCSMFIEVRGYLKTLTKEKYPDLYKIGDELITIRLVHDQGYKIQDENTLFNTPWKVKYYFEFGPDLINAIYEKDLSNAARSYIETIIKNIESKPKHNAWKDRIAIARTRAAVVRPSQPEALIPSKFGGKSKSPKCKKTTNKMMIAGKLRVIYEGARGGRYVKMNGKFVNIKKINK